MTFLPEKTPVETDETRLLSEIVALLKLQIKYQELITDTELDESDVQEKSA